MRKPHISMEAERRFLVSAYPLNASVIGAFHQGYLFIVGPVEMRVRSGVENSVAVKFAQGFGRRLEFETEVPKYIAKFLLLITPWRLSKTRSVLHFDGQRWDIDIYNGNLEGVITAEAETVDFDTLVVPEWVAEEVTENPGWSNKSLARYGLPT